MQIGITSSPYYGLYDFEDGFKKMKSHGYDCVDYRGLTKMDSELFALSDEEFRDFFKRQGKAARECGIEVFQMHSIWLTVGFDKTEEDRQKTLEYFIRQMEAAYYMECKYFVLHPFMPFGHDVDVNHEFAFDINVELLKRLIPFAEKFDVILCVENMPFKNNPISTVSEIKRIVRTVDHPRVKVCLDTGHANIFSNDIAADVRLLGDDLATLHVHDNSGNEDEHKLPYWGTIKWEEFLSALGEIGFDGCFSLETSISGKMPKPFREEMMITLAKLTRQMSEKCKKIE